MEKINRYSCDEGYYGMTICENGEYILYSDYDKLKKSHDNLLISLKQFVVYNDGCGCGHCQAIKQAEEL